MDGATSAARRPCTNFLPVYAPTAPWAPGRPPCATLAPLRQEEASPGQYSAVLCTRSKVQRRTQRRNRATTRAPRAPVGSLAWGPSDPLGKLSDQTHTSPTGWVRSTGPSTASVVRGLWLRPAQPHSVIGSGPSSRPLAYSASVSRQDSAFFNSATAVGHLHRLCLSFKPGRLVSPPAPLSSWQPTGRSVSRAFRRSILCNYGQWLFRRAELNPGGSHQLKPRPRVNVLLCASIRTPDAPPSRPSSCAQQPLPAPTDSR